VAALAPVPPFVVERLYSRGWYPAVQPLVTGASNLVAIAWLDVLVALAGIALVWWFLHCWRQPGGLLRRAGRAAAGLLQAVALAYLLFLAAWGWNYRRLPADARFAVEPDRISAGRLTALARRSIAELNRLHQPAHGDPALEESRLRPSLEHAFQQTQRELAAGWQPRPGRPKRGVIAQTFPLAAVDGMVNPFGLEVILNPEVLPIERPFVLAHEWAHLAGHAAESDASFVAWLTCTRGSALLAYSGWFSLLHHVVRTMPPAARVPLLSGLSDGPRADLRAVQARMRRVQPVVHDLSWQTYDRFLRANRVDRGIQNYDEVVRLVLGSRFAPPLDESSMPTGGRTPARHP
jgi:hypothetical protein